MRQAVIVASALFLIGCGPDPNAQLPGLATQSKTGGATATASGGSGPAGSGGAPGSGGVVGTGGTASKGGSGGGNSFVGGTTGSTGGIVSSGGALGSGGVLVGSGGAVVGSGGGGGGRVGTGGGLGGGGRVGTGGGLGSGGRLGSGGVLGSGGGMGIDGGGGSEPCVPAKTIVGSGSGNSGSFGTTGAFCFRTADNIAGWGCSNLTGRTLKVNGVVKECAALPLPAKVDGYYYFDASAGGVDYASIYWY